MTAVCGLIALEDWEEQLTNDNNNAKFLAKELGERTDIAVSCDPESVKTNMFAFVIKDKITKKKPKSSSLDHIGLCGLMKEKYNILMFPSFQNDAIRVVTHRDVNFADMEYVRDSIKEALDSYL